MLQDNEINQTEVKKREGKIKKMVEEKEKSIRQKREKKKIETNGEIKGQA